MSQPPKRPKDSLLYLAGVILLGPIGLLLVSRKVGVIWLLLIPAIIGVCSYSNPELFSKYFRAGTGLWIVGSWLLGWIVLRRGEAAYIAAYKETTKDRDKTHDFLSVDSE